MVSLFSCEFVEDNNEEMKTFSCKFVEDNNEEMKTLSFDSTDMKKKKNKQAEIR